MAKVRLIRIKNFRALKQFEWHPGGGLNCLIGPGDSGKSTVIDAIDLALGARQSKLFSDADFHMLNTDEPIYIEITVGDLSDPLKNYEKYDLFLRGYNLSSRELEDEPGDGLETALTICLTVGSDLDPIWSLYSERAKAEGRERNLSWGDRVHLAGTRIGNVADYHLSWRRGAVLNRIGDEKPNTTSAIAEANRAARKAFGEGTQPNLGDVLNAVSATASELGVPLSGDLQALLNAHSISLSGGTISVHDGNGLPLGSLGLGSSRLLVAGLLEKAKTGSNLVLVDELEHGLEPHRIIRFLDAIGAKDPNENTQAFVTTHSPIVLRELNSHQLFRVLRARSKHEVVVANINESSQGSLRRFPEAFLAKAVILCEGASEVGFLRGLDQHFVQRGKPSIWARGVTFLDLGGVSNLYNPAPTLQALGYRIASFRDDDVPPNLEDEADFESKSGTVFKWRTGQKIEGAIIDAASDALIAEIMMVGAEFVSEEIANEHIKTSSSNQSNFKEMYNRAVEGELPLHHREWLIEACTTKKNSWFKSVSRMEQLARETISKNGGNLAEDFRLAIKRIFAWAHND